MSNRYAALPAGVAHVGDDGQTLDVVAEPWPGLTLAVPVRCDWTAVEPVSAADRLDDLVGTRCLVRPTGLRCEGRELCRVLTADGTDVRAILKSEGLVR